MRTADYFYSPEGRQRLFWYPPPYNGGYATPWLWYDGDPDGGYIYSQWEAKITARMALPAPVTITMWGYYIPADDTGRVYAQFRNDSSATISGHAYFVLTEDSLYQPTGNGDLWHNHVSRDYIPSHLGIAISVAAGDSVTLDQPLSFDPTWQRHMCEIISWIQDDNLQADSTKEVWQGGILQVTDLTFVEEEISDEAVAKTVTVSPNPCVTSTAFMFDVSPGSAYTITLYDVAGRIVRTIDGTAVTGRESVRWNARDRGGNTVSSGVYFYDFTSTELRSSGKIIVQ